MPHRLPTPCAHPGCPKLSHTPRCDSHTKQRQRDYNRERRADPERTDAYYSSRHWRKLRAAKLREEPLCRACRAEGKVTAANEVDHIDGNRENEDWDNLQSLCKTCHSSKTAKEDGRFGK